MLEASPAFIIVSLAPILLITVNVPLISSCRWNEGGDCVYLHNTVRKKLTRKREVPRSKSYIKCQSITGMREYLLRTRLSFVYMTSFQNIPTME